MDEKLNLEKEKNKLKDAKKEKIEKEKKDLLVALAGGNFSKKKTKVAYILCLYPDTRNSDITLTLKYWETFQPDIYNPKGIRPKDLFKLERLHYIVRARAKIQNEYKLYSANSKIRKFRKKHEEEIAEEILRDSEPKKVVSIFSDETGKTQDYVTVASVWVLFGPAVYTVTKAIEEWQEKSLWARREVHFSRLGKRDIDILKEYLGVILKNREYLSFKAITVEKSKTKRSIEEVLKKLHEYMLIKGFEHEESTKRISLPQTLDVTIDEEQSLDVITLEELKRSLNEYFGKKYNNDAEVVAIRSISSKASKLVQLSDIVAGAINRKLHNPDGKHYKDEMADLVIGMLDLQLSENEVEGLDVSVLFKI